MINLKVLEFSFISTNKFQLLWNLKDPQIKPNNDLLFFFFLLIGYFESTIRKKRKRREKGQLEIVSMKLVASSYV